MDVLCLLRSGPVSVEMGVKRRAVDLSGVGSVSGTVLDTLTRVKNECGRCGTLVLSVSVRIRIGDDSGSGVKEVWFQGIVV